MKVAVFRESHFNAAHRLHVGEWSEDKNREVFGVCNNPFYHGHNYRLIVRLSGETDPVSGMLIDLNHLSKLIETNIIDYLDHKNLNIQIPEFETQNPTVENICFVIYQRLRTIMEDRFDLRIRLYETERNFAEYPVE